MPMELSSTSAARTMRSRRCWAPLNYRNLDDVPEFKGRNTTTEFLSKHIFDGLAKPARAGELGRPGRELKALRITLSESHVARAQYEAPLW